MKVSVITTCFNRAGTIRASIDSLLAQDYDDIEHIIVDGASTDGTMLIVDEYTWQTQTETFQRERPHFSLRVVSEPDSGMYEAINKGIRMATGEVIALLHSDDTLFDPHTLSAAMETITRTGCELLYADGLYVDSQHPNLIVRDWRGGAFAPWKVRHGWLPLHTTTYIRRDTMERLGLYDEQYLIASDTDLLLRYLLTPGLKVEYLRRYVVRMKVGGLSTNILNTNHMWAEDVRIMRTHHMPLPPLKKVEKMMWKVPQYLRAAVKNVLWMLRR